MTVGKELVYGSPDVDSDNDLEMQGMSQDNRSDSRSPQHILKGELGTHRRSSVSPSKHSNSHASPLAADSVLGSSAPVQTGTLASATSPTTKSAHADQPSNTSNARGGGKEPNSSAPSTVVGAFGLSLFTTELELRGLFSAFGKITHCTIIRDAQTLRSRGFGFITFEDVESAVKSQQELNGVMLNDRVMRVDFSISSRPHDPTPGFYKGKSTRDGGYERRHFREQSRPSYNPYPERRDHRHGHGRDMDRGMERGMDRGSGGRGPPLYRARSRSPPPYYRDGHGDGWGDRGERPVDRRMDHDRPDWERMRHGGEYDGGSYRSGPRGAPHSPMHNAGRYRGGYGGRSNSPIYESRGRR
ncbi:hypothetical protein BSLG_000437 [Batrachochytrium salamandrivorans]|nr:hypothetical protein BSLG_000437 [Batrachochytrium salamandrivorans]